MQSRITDFISNELLESQIEESKKLMRLDQNEEFCKAWKNLLEIERRQEVDSVLSIKLSKRGGHKKNLVVT